MEVYQYQGWDNIMKEFGNLLGNVGRIGLGIGTFGLSELARAGEQERLDKVQQERRDLIRIVGGQTIPAFARAGGAEPSSPEEIRQAQFGQLANLGTPAALQLASQISPLTQGSISAVSPVGKINQDFRAGLTSRETTDALIKRATSARQPLVTITSGNKSRIRTTRDQLRGGLEAVNLLISKIEADPTKAGIIGSGRGVLETGAGVLTDIASTIPGFNAISETFKDFLPKSGESIRALKPIQNKLAMGLARARQGDTGRLLASQLKSAKEDSTIAGFTSGTQSLDSLRQVRAELQSSLESLFGRAGEAGFDLPKGKITSKVIRLDENFNVIE